MSLQLISLHRSLGGQRILEDVSLHVRRGDCYGLLGHNGAGKTTAMRIALGLLRPSAGRVLIDGFDARRHVREARARMGGLIEAPGFFGELNGGRNLRLLARLRGLDRRTARSESLRLLELVGLAEQGRKRVRAYSQGMRQRLGIAQALVGNPRYVLLDEPTNGLDPEGIEELRSVLLHLNRDEGVTILVSSHQLHEIAEMCNRVGILRQGKVLLEKEVGELLEEEGGPYLLQVSDGDRASEIADGLGLASRAQRGGALELELGGHPPEEVARALVEGGAGLRSFARRPLPLEEIYLRVIRTGASASAPPLPAAMPARAEPGEKLARGFPIARVLRHEVGRLLSRPLVLAALGLPALVAAANILFSTLPKALEAQREIETEALYSTTAVTGFQAYARAVQVGIPLLALIIVLFAATSIAGENLRGTLRNLLLTPLRRFQLAFGKGLSLALILVVSYGALIIVAALIAGKVFGFGDVVEVLPNGETYPYVEAGKVWPIWWELLWRPLLPLGAYLGVGFFFSAALRSAVSALVSTIGAWVVFEIGWSFASVYKVESWLPSTYLPRLLGDKSFVLYYKDCAEGVSNASFAYGSSEVLVPLGWALLSFILAVVILMRRSVR